jgi:hypothetical protein
VEKKTICINIYASVELVVTCDLQHKLAIKFKVRTLTMQHCAQLAKLLSGNVVEVGS